MRGFFSWRSGALPTLAGRVGLWQMLTRCGGVEPWGAGRGAACYGVGSRRPETEEPFGALPSADGKRSHRLPERVNPEE